MKGCKVWFIDSHYKSLLVFVKTHQKFKEKEEITGFPFQK